MKLSLARVGELLRAGAAGIAATAIDLGVLALLVSVFHVDARLASLPALVAGGIANFIGNRHFAFRAKDGDLRTQVIGYAATELVALALNGFLYDTTLRLLPATVGVYWLVRLVTSHVVFLGWSYPLWRRVFATAHA